MMTGVPGDAQVVVPGFARRNEIIGLPQTSVPVWAPHPSVLPTATSLVTVALGADAEEVLTNLSAGATVPVTHLAATDAWAADFSAQFVDLLNRHRIGVRVIVCGPEHHILRAASIARSAGAIDAELSLFATDVETGYLADDGLRRVFCGYCHHIQEMNAAIGDSLVCAGCSAALTIHYHYSRPQAAYLGVPNGMDLES